MLLRESRGSSAGAEKGQGRLLAYSDVSPRKSLVDGFKAAFEWENGGKLMVDVTWKQEKEGVSDVVFSY